MNKKTGGKKASKKRKLHRPTAVTKLHPPEVPASVGSDERLLMKKMLAFKNRWERGMNNIENAQAIAEAMQLPAPPDPKRVSQWINEVYVEARGQLIDFAKQELIEGTEKLKGMVNRFYPMAMGRLHIRRTVEIDGQMVEIIDEKDYQEQIKASELVGKHIIRINDLLTGGTKENDAASVPGGLKSLQLTLIQNVRNEIYQNAGDKPRLVLTEGSDAE